MTFVVVKRDHTEEQYNAKKIENVLNMAFTHSDTTCTNLEELVSSITKDIEALNESKISIEKIQNIVEKNLMKYQYFDTAKHYIEYRHVRQELRNAEGYISKIPDNVETPWGMLGYITYKRTYARSIDDKGNTEEFRDTILRILKASQKQLGVGFTNEELKKAYYYLMSLKCSVAGRFAWQLGTKTVDKLGIMSLQNCAFVKIDDPIHPFLWIFDVLMLGTGVGFSIENKHIEKLPPLVDADVTVTRKDTKDADFIVPDSREGWVSLLEKMLEAYFIKGKSFTYSTTLIRSAGSVIHGFGGVASGPEDLVKGLNNIQEILRKKRGQRLTSVDCLDIVNIIATIVVAGNVRRCLPEDSLVHTKDGLKEIKDVRIGDMVLTAAGYEEVTNVFNQGRQDVVKIITQDGEFRCTPNHRMAVIKSPTEYTWKMAKDLKKDDILMTTRQSVEGGFTRLPISDDVYVPYLDEYVAWMVGLLKLKELYEYDKVSGIFSYRFKKDEYDIALRLKDCLNKFVDEASDAKIGLIRHNKYYVVRCQSPEIQSYIFKYIRNFSEIDVIPKYIMQGDYDVRASYIAGVIDGNVNCISYDGRKYFNIASCFSGKFIKALQALCYSCGFETKQKTDNSYGVDLYKLEAITKHSLICIQDIKVLLKYQIVESYSDMVKGKSLNSFPAKMIIKATKNSHKAAYIHRKLGLENVKNVSIDSYDQWFDDINYCPVRVVKIGLDVENVKTYDIEVKNRHEFYCNGYLTHNSALIALGDYDDIAYLKAKDWSSGNIPNWRCMSNNSVVCDDTSKLPPEFWEGYNGTSEPYGLINLELSKKIGRIKDGEKYPDPGVEGYNPCFAAETLIAVADGRGAVPIKTLAEEGKDVPVYSVNEEGIVDIKWGRNPRVTGENQKMVKVILDDNTYIKTTLNHKFRLKTGEMVEAKDLQPKMSLIRLNKTRAKVTGEDNTSYIRVNTDTNNSKKGQIFEHRLIARFHHPEKFESMYNEEVQNGLIKGGVVVHHKDYNGLNNCIDNLEIMTFSEHAKFHGEHDQSGENNGMYGKTHSDESKVLIGAKTKERSAKPEYKAKMSQIQKAVYEKKPELKQNMKKAQEDQYKKWCEEMIKSTDLPTFFEDGILHCKKVCEHCKNEFSLPFTKREVGYCSITCSNSSAKAVENRRIARNVGIKEKQKQILHDQVMVYKDLEEKLGRDPMKKEWEDECRLRKVAFRIRHGVSANEDNEYLLKSFQDLKDRAKAYNHRVKSIEFLEDTETVYNITVDDNHTVGIFTTYRNGAGNGVFVPQCGEQSLSNFETCCLGEIYLSNVTSYEELKDIATTIYRICKHSLLLKCHHKGTEDIVHKNLRMGIGITGYMQASDEQKSWLDPLYEYLREFDKEYSDKHGFSRSVKITTVKPSGTLSLLAGVTSGCHPAIYQYFIRRIRISSSNPLIQLCKSKGYHVEYQRNFDGTDDKNTMIVEFPCCYPIGSKLAKDMTVIDQLEVVKHLQTVWSDNSVSCTVYYRLHEIEDMKKWLAENYKDGVKTCSFLLHNDHGFQQAPFEEITKEKYEELMKNVVPITSGNGTIMVEDNLDYSAECAGGVCPIR